jgi:hypothetical protein
VYPPGLRCAGPPRRFQTIPMPDIPPRSATAALMAGRRAGARPHLLPAALLVLLFAVLPAAAHAQVLKPWVPPDMDSLRTWAADARSAFQSAKGDSATGPNYHAYDVVGRMGRKLLRSLGRANLIQAPAVKTVLDSLGLETDIRVDPLLPHFALLMVRNPYRRSAHAVGYLFWYLENDLRVQGVSFVGGSAPDIRVWWTGRENAPYAWGIVERARAESRYHLTVLSLTPNGQYWRISEYDPNGLDLGAGASVSWVDLNSDLQPELVAWVPAAFDSTVLVCDGCPHPVNELTYVESARGFQLLDVRLVPSPVTTFTLFARLLAQGDRAGASRLLENPAKIEEAASLGWTQKSKRPWRVLYVEPNTAWPAWLMVRHELVAGRAHDWKVTMAPVRGRWVIAGWDNRDDATTPGFLPPDSLARKTSKAPAKKPAKKPAGAAK